MANVMRTGDPCGFNKGRRLKVPEFDKHMKKAGGHIDRNVVEITIKIYHRYSEVVWSHSRGC